MIGNRRRPEEVRVVEYTTGEIVPIERLTAEAREDLVFNYSTKKEIVYYTGYPEHLKDKDLPF